jgi:hypothetical protein
MLQCRLYDTAECCQEDSTASVMILRIFAIDSIAIQSVDDNQDDDRDVSILHNAV